MNTKVQKWGNSLAFRIPSRTAKRLGLKAGSKVTTRDSFSGIYIEPVGTRRIETLDDMLDRITPETIHPETDWGKPVGKEIW